MEEWKVIEDFPDYSVSTLGRVRNDHTGRILHHKVNQSGLVFVGLRRDLHQEQRSLPLLVARAFLEDPPPSFDTPITINGDREDCRVYNLMWRPRWFSIQFNQQFKERYFGALDLPIRAVDTDEIFENTLEVAMRFGLLERDVVLSINNGTVVWPTWMKFELA